MARKRTQKKSRHFQAKAPAPIVNIAEPRSVRAPLQPDRKASVFIAVPTVDGQVHSSIAATFARAMASSSLPECPFRFGVHLEPGKRPVDHARNCIVKQFIEETDSDWLVMIDQDEVVPDNFWQLCMVTDADIVSGLTPVWVGNMDAEAMLRINAYGVDEKGQCYNLPIPDKSVDQPYRVPVCGTGGIAIRRRVFAPPPHGLGLNPFFFSYGDDRRVQAGEDVNFSVMANRANFVLAVHPAVRFDHVKAMPLWQIEQYYQARKAMEDAGKATSDKQRVSVG